MPGHDIIVIGASAGGVEALAELARGLPADLPASLFVVHHFPAYAISVLPGILNRSGPLNAAHAEDDEPIRPGRIYVAPPNYHLLVKRGHVQLLRGPRENGHRPAVDPLFRSAALAYGPRVVGVILSGTLDDGSEGLRTVKKRGGVAVVQDPEEALYSGMPASAIEHVAVDHVLRLQAMPAVLAQLARQPVKEGETESMSNEITNEAALTEMDPVALGSETHPGTPASFGCPECGGTLWELSEGELLRFRCRVGHAFTADALLVEQTEALEAALWTALRALEERSSLARRLSERARRRGHGVAADRFANQVRETQQRAAIIREVLVNGDVLDPLSSRGEGVSNESEGRASGHPLPHG
jgi:two-component system, chemotaxis family, protein-glutamate methylesterase/glutaminase